MNIYEIVKTAVTTRQAAERYGLTVGHGGMTCCPFHDDRHPSMKVDERYYCFGCQETGDVIDFTAKLLGISGYEAACRLSADFGGAPSAAACKVPKAVHYHRDDNLCFQTLSEYLRLLRDWRERYAPASPEDKPDVRFIESCRIVDYIEYLTDIFITGGRDERTNVVDDLIKDKKIQTLRSRLNRLSQEGEQQRERDDYDISI